MSARRALTRGVVIRVDVDPELVPAVSLWSSSLTVRLLPCRGGVRLLRSGKAPGPLCGSPDALASELECRALDWAILASEVCPGTATHLYREDRWRFYLAAAKVARTDPRCRGLWDV